MSFKHRAERVQPGRYNYRGWQIIKRGNSWFTYDETGVPCKRDKTFKAAKETVDWFSS